MPYNTQRKERAKQDNHNMFNKCIESWSLVFVGKYFKRRLLNRVTLLLNNAIIIMYRTRSVFLLIIGSPTIVG